MIIVVFWNAESTETTPGATALPVFVLLRIAFQLVVVALESSTLLNLEMLVSDVF
jgi:hypothetical protein